jgi:hypothetical protein
LSRETSHTTHTINFEITVPRIIPPIPASYPSSREAHTAEQTNDMNEIVEQIRFTVIDQSNQIQPMLEPQNLQNQTTTRANQVGVFRLFFIKYVTIPGHRFLLQILRHRPTNESRASKKVPKQPVVTAELFVQVEYQTTSSASPKAPIQLLPGLNRVTIIFDEEHTPTDYSIDGI